MQHNFYGDKRAGVGIDVDLTNFRASNLKNMKKFLKLRTDTVADTTPPMQSPESIPHEEGVQPPLPLEPPPPDEILPLVKYHSSPVEQFDDTLIPKKECTTPEPEIKCEDLTEYIVKEAPKPPNLKIICKDFIRGTCSRVECKYRHEVDLAQLRGILIFCHNFQNSVCLKPNCKYVHADVFEEQKFYRTGELPKILKQPQPPKQASSQNQSSQPALPPPPPPVTENETSTDANTFVVNVNKPPPQFMPKPEQQLISGVFNTSLNMEAKSPMSGTKRSWSDTDDGLSDLFNSPSPHEESRLKRNNDGRCESCKVMENRLKYADDRLKEIWKSVVDSNLKMFKLEKKHMFLLQLASTITSARLNERDNVNMNQPTGSMFSQIDLQHVLQQSSAMSDQLSNFKNDQKKMSSHQATNLTAQLRHVMQQPPHFNKISNSDDNGTKAYQLVPQLQLPVSSNTQYQLQSGSVNAVSGDPNSVRIGDMRSTRQFSNLLNGW